MFYIWSIISKIGGVIGKTSTALVVTLEKKVLTHTHTYIIHAHLRIICKSAARLSGLHLLKYLNIFILCYFILSATFPNEILCFLHSDN